MAFLDEMLPPAKRTALAQLKMRHEVSLFGLKVALLEGNLGKKVGVHENQLTNLEGKASKIMADAEAKVKKIRMEAEAALLDELSTEQHSKAKELLGPYFEYSEMDERVARMNQMKSRMKERQIQKQ